MVGVVVLRKHKFCDFSCRLFVRGFACQVPEWCMSIPVGGISYVSQGFAFAFVGSCACVNF